MQSAASLPPYLFSGVAIHQPPHLEGDASFATEILPGPPSLVSAQQSIVKRDPRKPATVFSYLPPSDPGSTYSGIMHGTLIGHEPEAARLKRTKAATGRAQRASARNQNGATPVLEPVIDTEGGSTSAPPLASVDSEYTMVIDDEPIIFRSNSTHNPQEGPSGSTSGRPKRKDKGKAKESEPVVVRVKEEPKAVSLHSPEPLPNTLTNDDHCSSCRSHGALVYCDGCPRAFHLWCLDPPMESVDEGDSRWFCPGCTIRKHPPRKPPPSLLSPLIHQVETTIPTEFQLPDDVRTFFKDVATGPRGTYVDGSELKQPRLNRHGQLEDRDAHRLRDRNGAPVLCFKCGTSALPAGLAATAPATKRTRRSSSKVVVPENWKNIISCDYCNLHWHLDCLDPPLSTMPVFTKKWMCPNHVEQILPPKRRIPKNNVPPIEITKPNQFNNGNIEVIHPETTRLIPSVNKVAVDEVLINGRRYRVPERVIVLDFWSKLNKSEKQPERDSNIDSGMSSPLTSLSSLDDLDEPIPTSHFPSQDEDLKAAQLLCTLQGKVASVIPRPPVRPVTVSSRKKMNLDTMAEPTPPLVSKVMKAPKAPAVKRTASKTRLNGVSKISVATSSGGPLVADVSVSGAKRKRQAPAPLPQPSTRELRSRSRNNAESSLTSISSRSSVRHVDDLSKESLPLDSSISAPPIASSFPKSRNLQIKVEEGDVTLADSSLLDRLSITTPTKPAHRQARTRVPSRRMSQKDLVSIVETKEKRGKKRKEREDELPGIDVQDHQHAADRASREKRGKEKKEAVRLPRLHASSTTVSAPPTPSLKIRLPRLGATHNAGPAMPGANGDTPTKL